MAEKEALDVIAEMLLSLEQKVDKLLQQKKLEEFTEKLILERMNKMVNILENKVLVILEKAMESDPEFKVPSGDLGAPPSAVSQNPAIRHLEPLTVDESPQDLRRTSRSETYNEQKSNDQPKGNDQAKTVFIDSDKRVPVIQRVVDASTSKNLFMANVEVMNAEKVVVYKGKTNASGKWQAHLPVGKYAVLIQKKDTVSGKTMTLNQSVNIPSSDSPFELPLAIIKQ